MNKIDLCAADVKAVKTIVKCFMNQPEAWSLTHVCSAFWRSDEYLEDAVTRSGGALMKDKSVHWRAKDKTTLDLWTQGKHYMMSFDLTYRIDPCAVALYALSDVMQKLGRRDYPVKIDKGDTITIKAAVAIAALAVAQGVYAGGSCGILWDMARDKEI